MPKENFYDRHIAPHLVNCACGLNLITAQRQKIVPKARGVVLELGIGSGLNLPYYQPDQVKKLIGIDPGAGLAAIGRKRFAAAQFPVELLALSAETIPLPDASVDSVLVTYSLCTIPDPHAALAEAHRVLKPGGPLLFCEHGRSHQPGTAKWQDRLTPLWRRLAGGCHLNRDMEQLVKQGRFEIETLDHFCLAHTPALIGTHYLGEAIRRT